MKHLYPISQYLPVNYQFTFPSFPSDQRSPLPQFRWATMLRALTCQLSPASSGWLKHEKTWNMKRPGVPKYPKGFKGLESWAKPIRWKKLRDLKHLKTFLHQAYAWARPLHSAHWPRRSTWKSPSFPKEIGRARPSPPCRVHMEQMQHICSICFMQILETTGTNYQRDIDPNPQAQEFIIFMIWD